MTPLAGIQQFITPESCPNPFILAHGQNCVLSLQVIGSLLNSPINYGPVVCERGNPLQCYRPSAADSLNVTPISPSATAVIAVTGSPLTLTTNGTQGSLTITNISSTVTAINVNADFTNTALQGKVTQVGSTCNSLAPGASCTLTFSAIPPRTPPTSFPIHGTNTNTVNAIISIRSLFAYVANGTSSGANNITRCDVLANGNFDSPCANSGAGQGLDSPTGLIINQAGTFTYITNFNNSTVSKCSLGINGNLTTCSYVAGASFTTPSGITFNPLKNLIYVVNTTDNNVTYCQVDNDGNLNCAPLRTGDNLDFPVDIAINPLGSFAYITNFNTNNITRCVIDADGSLTPCAALGASFSAPFGIVITKTGTTAYVVNAGPPGVSKCTIDNSGDIVNCVSANATSLIQPRYIALNAEETMAYITDSDSSANTVTKCTINPSTGLFDSCNPTGDSMNGPQGIKLFLF